MRTLTDPILRDIQGIIDRDRTISPEYAARVLSGLQDIEDELILLRSLSEPAPAPAPTPILAPKDGRK